MTPELRHILPVFSEELREHAAAVAQLVIEVERSGSAEDRRHRMEDFYRRVHGIKGSAGALGLTDIASAAHELESLLTPMRSGQRSLPPELVGYVLRSLDLWQRRVDSIASGSEGPDPELEQHRRHPPSAGSGAGGTAPAAPEPPLPAAPSQPESPRAAESLRVSVAMLGAIEQQLEDLREVRAELDQRRIDLDQVVASLEDEAPGGGRLELRFQGLRRAWARDVHELGVKLAAVDETLRRLQMVSADTLLPTLSRAVWETAKATSKRVAFRTSGAEVALDRKLLEELREPLQHLVRNAVDHGIEEAPVRMARTKPEEGSIGVRFEQRGDSVLIGVADDGSGLDLGRVRRRAVESQLLSEGAAQGLDDAALTELLFTPGFSTSPTLTATSGRGVGLDAVRMAVERIGGRVRVTSTPGQGAEFILEVPLTLASIQAVLFEAEGHLLALPLDRVARSRHVRSSEVEEGALDDEGQPIPLWRLGELIGVPSAPRVRPAFPALIYRAGERLQALAVDRLLGERELVLKPLPPELAEVPHLAAAGVLAGRLVFVLNTRALLGGQRAAAAVGPRPRLRIVVADDSVTTRTLHRQILEAAGFDVETAVDGQDALRILRLRSADLVVSDVQMPRLDGLALVRQLRASPATQGLPILLISSLDTEGDVDRARAAGASACLSKRSYQSGALLQAVRRLLPP